MERVIDAVLLPVRDRALTSTVCVRSRSPCRIQSPGQVCFLSLVKMPRGHLQRASDFSKINMAGTMSSLPERSR